MANGEREAVAVLLLAQGGGRNGQAHSGVMCVGGGRLLCLQSEWVGRVGGWGLNGGEGGGHFQPPDLRLVGAACGMAQQTACYGNSRQCMIKLVDH